MVEPFRWTNCYGDVMAWNYGIMALAFLNKTVEPSLVALDSQIAEWSRSDEPAAPFAHKDTQVLLLDTKKAFCLSIQSMWERQIRAYLRRCAKELKPESDLDTKIQNARWAGLDEIFFDLRKISLKNFDAYADLELLMLLGNVCRHGDGPSSKILFEKYPELWPKCNECEHGNIPTFLQLPQPVAVPDISRELLRRFVNAIVSFWEDANYIYFESIEQKGKFLEAKLATMRKERANL